MDRVPRPGELYRHFKNNLYQVITIAVHSETNEQMVIYQAMYGNYGIYARPLAQFVSEVDHEKYPHISQRYRFEKIERPEAGSAAAEYRHGAAGFGEREEAASNWHGAAGFGERKVVAAARDKGHAVGSGEKKEDIAGVESVRKEGRGASLRPRTQSPAESRRAMRQAASAGEGSNDDKRRRRQMEEREQRRELFRRQERHGSATEELHANPNLLKFLDTETYEEKYQVLNEIQNDITDRLIDDIAVVLDVVIPEGPLSDRFYQLRNIVLTRQKYEINRFRR